jgi:hypothetical protein
MIFHCEARNKRKHLVVAADREISNVNDGAELKAHLAGMLGSKTAPAGFRIRVYTGRRRTLVKEIVA